MAPIIIISYGMIRRWEKSDVEALAKYANNRNIWLNLRDGFPHPYTRENAQSFLQSVSRQDPVRFYAIATQEEAIGAIGITPNQDVHRLTAEMGYWLAEPYWGKGIMTETVTKFTDYVFEHFGLVRIYAEPYAYNASSCRVLEKAGFVLEGRMRCSAIKDGQMTDQFLYAKIKGGGSDARIPKADSIVRL
jgi:ribosomal-protein-alanine N-acetyltransferase